MTSARSFSNTILDHDLIIHLQSRDGVVFNSITLCLHALKVIIYLSVVSHCPEACSKVRNDISPKVRPEVRRGRMSRCTTKSTLPKYNQKYSPKVRSKVHFSHIRHPLKMLDITFEVISVHDLARAFRFLFCLATQPWRKNLSLYSKFASRN